MALSPTSSRSAGSGTISGVTVTGVAAANKLIVAADASNGSWQALASGKVSDTSGDKTTVSTSFVDLAAGITITTGARRVMLVLSGSGSNGTVAKYIRFTFLVDGVNQGGTNYGLWTNRMPSTSVDVSCCGTFITDVLAAGSHTFKVQWSVDAGTGNFYASATEPLVFSAIELPNT